MKKVHLFEKCKERYIDELDIKTLLTKIRDSYSILRYVRSKEIKILLRYNKDRAIEEEDRRSKVLRSDSDTDKESSDQEIGNQ
jgi:hypothetical protein